MVTIDDPEIAENTAHLRIVATARPPGTGRVSSTTTAISRPAIEPRLITDPTRMNSGTARMTSRSIADHMS